MQLKIIVLVFSAALFVGAIFIAYNLGYSRRSKEYTEERLVDKTDYLLFLYSGCKWGNKLDIEIILRDLIRSDIAEYSYYLKKNGSFEKKYGEILHDRILEENAAIKFLDDKVENESIGHK